MCECCCFRFVLYFSFFFIRFRCELQFNLMSMQEKKCNLKYNGFLCCVVRLQNAFFSNHNKATQKLNERKRTLNENRAEQKQQQQQQKSTYFDYAICKYSCHSNYVFCILRLIMVWFSICELRPQNFVNSKARLFVLCSIYEFIVRQWISIFCRPFGIMA